MFRLYKGHAIVASAACSPPSQSFIPMMHIAWKVAGAPGSHSMIFADRFPESITATNYALAEAKAWVDRHAVEVD